MTKKYKLIMVLLISFVSSPIFSQTYRALFDQLDKTDNGSSSFHTNIDRHLTSENGILLEAYLNMFKATNDMRYLDKFVILAKRVQDRRDDNIGTAVVTDLPNDYTFYADDGSAIRTCTINSTSDIGSSRAWTVWDANVAADKTQTVGGATIVLRPGSCSQTQLFKEAAELCLPMAEFILMLETDYSYLNTVPLPAEVNKSTATHNNYGAFPCVNYQDFGIWLRYRVGQTISWFDAQYVNSCPSSFCSNPLHDDSDCCNQPEGTISEWSYYQFTENNTGGINQQLYMGTLLAYMYQITVARGEDGTSIAQGYLFKVRNMLSDFLYHIHNSEGEAQVSHPSVDGVENSYIWCHGFGCDQSLVEDVSHAVIDLRFMDACYKFGIQDYVNGQLVSSSDMHDLSNTFAYNIVSAPLQMHKNVAGGDGTCDQCDPAVTPDRYGYYTGQFAFLLEYNNPKIYQIISDFYAPDNVANYDISTNASSRWAVSYLAMYEHLFNPLAVQRNSIAPGYSYNSGACGDFVDGDGNKVFVLSRIVSAGSIDTKIIESKLDNSNNIVTVNTFTKTGTELYFLSKGEIVTGNSQDEFVAIDLVNDRLEIYKIESGALVNILQASLSSLGLDDDDIRGTAVADFHPLLAGDEIVVNTKSGGVPFLKMYHFNGTGLTQITTTISGGTITDIDGFCAGQFDATAENQIAVYQNSTNKIEVYRFDGDDEFIPVSVGTIPTPSEVWKGICSGDFDGTGVDELMLYQENPATGRFEIFSVISGVVTLKDIEYFPKNQQNHMMCSMRFDKYGQSDALVTFRDYDSQISIFNMDGLCPGLDLANQTLDGSTTIDNPHDLVDQNNYTLDYHVNSTIIAGSNFIIDDPSIVEMSSGKEIKFKDGFTALAGSDLHAYIEPALECTPSTFRRQNPYPPQQPSARPVDSGPSNVKAIENKDIAVMPNPNNGSFQIMVTRNEKAVGVKEVKVFDIMGKVVWETGPSTNNVFVVDITGYAAGIYYVKSTNEFDEISMKKLIKQ